MQIRFTLETHAVWRQVFLRNEQFTFGVRKMLDGQKFVSYTEKLSLVLQWHRQQPASFFTSGIQKFADR